MNADLTEEQIDKLRIAAFKSNAEADRQAYFAAASKWFQDRHYRATARHTEVVDETGWLVELKGSEPMWWSLDPADEPAWTKDANKALRFARKVDADTFILDAGWTEAFASEHMWPALRRERGRVSK
jgi:hypothetical protein